jgi:DnaJ-class molecular chaperone
MEVTYQMSGGEEGVIRMKVIKEKALCKQCNGTGVEMYLPYDVVSCEVCQGKGEIMKNEFVMTVSQRAIDDTNEWMKGLKDER